MEKRAHTSKKKDSIPQYQINYINEYHKLFMANSSLASECERLEKVVESQRITIDRLRGKLKNFETVQVAQTSAQHFQIPPATNEPEEKEKSLMSQNQTEEKTEVETEVKTDQLEQLIAELDFQPDQNADVPAIPQTQMESPAISDNVNEQMMPTTKHSAKAKKEYVCSCGYKAGNRKNRLTVHQQQHCRLVKKTAPIYKCEICDIEMPYEGIKSHLRQYAKPARQFNVGNEKHAKFDANYHLKCIEDLKLFHKNNK